MFRPYMGSNYALQFASPRVASFIAGLFMEVAEAAALELCGWVPSFPEYAYASPTCLHFQNSFEHGNPSSRH